MAAAPTFSVTRAMVEAEFNGLDLTDLDSQITTWLTGYAAILSADLRARGYVAATVAADTTDDLYSLAQQYLTHRLAERVASSITQQYPDKARAHREQWQEIRDTIRIIPEAVSANWDRNEQQGSWTTHVELQGNQTSYPARTGTQRRWSREDKL